MCSTVTETISERHMRLAKVVEPMRGSIVNKTTVNAAWKTNFPELAHLTQWITLSDHCINQTNKAACRCAKTKLALFERVGRGEYRVL